MERKIKSTLSFASFMLLFFCGNIVANTLTPQEIAKRALDSTVLLVMEDTNGQPLGVGSGFFVQPNQIATNYHVIEGATKGTAKPVGQDVAFDIEGITAMDENRDLAILKVSNARVQPLSLADSDAVKVGDAVYVTGNPKGYLEGTFSDGLISGMRDLETSRLLQLTAPISSGSSGGPVLNKRGEVIGVSMAQIKDGQNLNFAVPSNYLSKLMAQVSDPKPLEGIAKSPMKLPQSKSAEAYYIRGIVKSALGLYKEAIVAFEIAIRLKPSYSEAYAARGGVKIDLGQYSDAIKDYDTAIELKPDYSDAYAGRGLAKVELGQYTEAVKDYDTAIQFEPDDARIYVDRARAKEKTERWVEAIADYDAVILLKPDNAEIYLSRGLVKVKLEQYADAIKDYDTAMRIKPEDAEIYANRGMANAFSGRHSEAVKDYDLTILMNPDYADAYANRGISKIHLGQYDSAINDLNTASKLRPDGFRDLIKYLDSLRTLRSDYPEVHVASGITKINLSQYAAAIADFDTAIQFKPAGTLAYIKRGYAKCSLEQYAAAIQDYDTAIRLKPDDAFAYRERGYAKHYRLEQYNAAIEDYDTAIQLKPDYAKAYYGRGESKCKLEQYPAAIQDYDTAIALDSDYVLAYISRADAKCALGRIEAAHEDYQTALALSVKLRDNLGDTAHEVHKLLIKAGRMLCESRSRH